MEKTTSVSNAKKSPGLRPKHPSATNHQSELVFEQIVL